MGVYKLSGAGGLLTPRVNYTSMLAGNSAFVPPPPPAYELIETTILGSAASSVTFSSLATYASDYKHLQIRSASLVNSSGNAASLRLNGDTAANYSRHYLEGGGSSVNSSGGANTDNMYYAYWPAGSTTRAHAAVVDIVDAFSTTKFKTVKSLNGQAPGLISLYSGNWRNTAAVTSVTIASANNFLTGSRFSLYGIRG